VKFTIRITRTAHRYDQRQEKRRKRGSCRVLEREILQTVGERDDVRHVVEALDGDAFGGRVVGDEIRLVSILTALGPQRYLEGRFRRSPQHDSAVTDARAKRLMIARDRQQRGCRELANLGFHRTRLLAQALAHGQEPRANQLVADPVEVAAFAHGSADDFDERVAHRSCAALGVGRAARTVGNDGNEHVAAVVTRDHGTRTAVLAWRIIFAMRYADGKCIDVAPAHACVVIQPGGSSEIVWPIAEWETVRIDFDSQTNKSRNRSLSPSRTLAAAVSYSSVGSPSVIRKTHGR
jgi:hypothetical protein